VEGGGEGEGGNRIRLESGGGMRGGRRERLVGEGIGGGCEGKGGCWFWDEEGVYYREIGVGVFGLGDCIIGIYSCEERKVLVQLYRLDVD